MRIFTFICSLCLLSCAGVQPRYHRVVAGESLAVIAKQYEVPVSELKNYNRGLLLKGLKKGQKLYIPFEENPLWNMPADLAAQEGRVDSNDRSAPIEMVRFRWPVVGPISSPFGPRKFRSRHERDHEGLDIAAPRGTKVLAARSGHVIYSANGISGYGNLVVIKHADRFSTVYGHLSRRLVKKGQYVAKGQRIGTVGRTGRSSGPHLHFEIRDGQTPIDPLLYLQGQYADNRVSR